MSYLLFGAIIPSGNPDVKNEKIAWDIVKLGIKNNLHIMLYPNIPQKIVNDMLRKQETETLLMHSFLITENPIQDTSDSLLFPSESENIENVHAKIRTVENWINSIFKLNGIDIVHLYCTEGYDTNFKLQNTNLISLFEMMCRELAKDQYIPSILFEIKK